MGNTIPFGWKSFALIYYSVGVLASHYFRSVSISCSLYIDDRHTVELKLPLQTPTYAFLPQTVRVPLPWPPRPASLIVSLFYVSLRYYINLAKSIFVPLQVAPYLGFLVDSVSKLSFSLRRSGKGFAS